ncbi:unnamed protein product, partial [Vitis vinifera]|uniref:Uncharacterized protein n=1 Tax=Vitis vinifera TaxID=29760 RepID=D7TNY3_VITVI
MSRRLALHFCGTLASPNFWNSFRFLNGMVQGINTFPEFFCKCHHPGQLSLVLKEGVIPCC